MNGSSVTLDKVTIQIDASANEAGKNIDELTSTLSELRNAVKGGFNNLSKLAKSIDELKNATKGLSSVSKNLDSLTSIQGVLQNLSNISNPKGLEKAIDNLERLPYVFNNLDTSVLKNVARVSQELTNALSPLSEKLGNISRGYSALSQMADRYGVQVTKVTRYTKQSTNYFKEYNKILSSMRSGFNDLTKQNEKFFKNLSKGASSAISKIKQIGLSLLGTRTIFTATRKAVSEYMAMDAELTWYITNNWRALGAQLAPAIEYVAWLFKQFVRVIYSVILALTGIDLIARANAKAMEGWGRAAKSTLGNLQKFDDLNVVEFPKGSGGDDNKLIELDTIDLSPIQKIIEWVRKLRDEIKEAWNSGQWEGVGEVLSEGLNSAIKAVDFDWLENKFKDVAEKFGDFLYGAVTKFDWETFGSQLSRQLSFIPHLISIALNEVPWSEIGDGLNKALTNFDINLLISSIFGAINSLITGLQTSLLRIDGKVIGQKISEGIISVLSNLTNLISNIDWGALGAMIHDVIMNIDWKGIWDAVVNLLKEAFDGLDDFFENIFGVDSGSWDTLKSAIVGIGVAFATYKIVESFTAISKLLKGDAITKFVSGLSQMAVPLGYLISIGLVIAGIYLVIQGIKDILEGEVWVGIQKVLIGISVILVGIALAIGSIPVVIAAAVALVLAAIVGLVKAIVDHWDELKESFSKLWTNIKEGWNKMTDSVKNAFAGMKKHAKEGLDGIKSKFSEWGSDIKTWWNEKIWNHVKNIPDNLKGIVNDAIGGIKKAFDGLSKFLGDFWTALKGGPKSFANFVIEKIEWLINKVIDGINWLKKQINKLSFDVPDWVPGIGGKKMGFNLSISDHVTLPRLETGTNRVPYEGVYYLHKDESVVPKKYNPAMGGGTNEETNRRLDMLIDVLSNMETTTVVNVGNDRLYKQQQKFTRRQNDKYGTDVNL